MVHRFHHFLGNIKIAHGPENVTVHEGESATFPCFTTGTADIAFWLICDSVYTIQDLPSRHTFFNWSLTITDVQPSDDGTTYQCRFLEVFSDTAVLTVIATSRGMATEHNSCAWNAFVAFPFKQIHSKEIAWTWSQLLEGPLLPKLQSQVCKYYPTFLFLQPFFVAAIFNSTSETRTQNDKSKKLHIGPGTPHYHGHSDM